MSKRSNKSGLSSRTPAVLAYHKVGEPPSGGWETWFYVPEATFAVHLRYLRESEWEVIALSDLLKGLIEPNSLPERAIMITFDDGYRSNLEVAVPWLLRFEYPAVLFVATDFIGRSNAFDAGIEPQEAICDWDALRELERHGIAVQSHGMSHRPMSKLSQAEQEKELRQSKAVLEAGLGNSVMTFSYPYGDGGTTPEMMRRMMQRAGYQAAFLYGGGPQCLPITNPYRLTRLAIGPDTNLKALLQSESGQ